MNQLKSLGLLHTPEEDGESLDEEDIADLPPQMSTPDSSTQINAELFRFKPLTQWQLVKSRSQSGVFVWRSVNLDPTQRYYAESSHCIRGPFQAQCAHYQIAHLRHRSTQFIYNDNGVSCEAS